MATEGRWKKLIQTKPHFILIQFGHNDSHAKERPESTDAETDYKNYLKSFIKEAKAIGATPILITPMHRRLFNKQGEPSSELLPYATAMKEVAKEHGVACVDLYSSSGKLLQGLGKNGSVDLFCKPTDYSHFSLKGAEKMAALIVDDLKTQNSSLVKYLRKTPLKETPTKGNSTQTKPVKANVHIYGKRSNISMNYDGGSKDVSGGYAEWMKEEKKKRITVYAPPNLKWTKSSFSFTPEASGKVILILMSNKKSGFVCYDDIKVTGAEVTNGDFEIMGKKGLPVKWSPMNKPVIVTGAKDAHSGKTYAKCSSKNRLNFDLTVEAGNKVTVSFWIRKDKAE